MAVALFIMPSCKKDKDASSLIIGTWEITEGSINNHMVSQYAGETFVFKSDGTFRGALYAEDKGGGAGADYTDGTYTISGNTLKIVEKGAWENEYFEFTIDEISNNKLELTGFWNMISAKYDYYKAPMSFKLKKK